jgi:hypothetical protein
MSTVVEVLSSAVAATLVATIVAAVVTSREGRRHRALVERQQLAQDYGLALAAILSWAEIPYRIARRVDNEPATITALTSHIHSLQEQINYHSQLLFIYSPDGHRAYGALVTATRGQAAPYIHDAWRRDPAATPEAQILGASYVVDVSQECHAFRDAVFQHMKMLEPYRRSESKGRRRNSKRDTTGQREFRTPRPQPPLGDGIQISHEVSSG